MNNLFKDYNGKECKKERQMDTFFYHLALEEIFKYMTRFMIGISIIKDKNN
jgi:hypothetical protein